MQQRKPRPCLYEQGAEVDVGAGGAVVEVRGIRKKAPLMSSQRHAERSLLRLCPYFRHRGSPWNELLERSSAFCRGPQSIPFHGKGRRFLAPPALLV